MNLVDPILAELSYEAQTTRKLLERLPEAQLTWKPHEKSMTLAQLASHIAEIPQWTGVIVQQDQFVLGPDYVPTIGSNVPEILAMFDKNLSAATDALQGQSNERLTGTWRLKKEDTVVMELPRVAVIRSMILNHLIHHRGQLSVYIRLQNVPVPSIYGPSADEGM